MTRNIVICCDGTRNQLQGRRTNVLKICEVLDRSSDDQVVYYDPGVGSIGDERAITRVRRGVTRMLGAMIGLGIREDVQQAYDFLAWHFRPGDRIFLFGYSRGAYTVRALAGLIHLYGLVGAGAANLSPHLVGMLCDDDWGWRRRPKEERWHNANYFKKILARPVTVHFMGAFDTVSSVGWFWNPLSLPFTGGNPSVHCVRHAVSLHERRAFFRQNLFRQEGGQDFKQVWFPGVHSDVGGGGEHARQALAQVAFRWMIHEAINQGLRVNGDQLRDVLSGRVYAQPQHTAPRNRSLDWRWLPLEFLPKPRRLRYVDQQGKKRWQLPFRINLCRLRTVPNDAVMHQSVIDRSTADPPDRPPQVEDVLERLVEPSWIPPPAGNGTVTTPSPGLRDPTTGVLSAGPSTAS